MGDQEHNDRINAAVMQAVNTYKSNKHNLRNKAISTNNMFDLIDELTPYIVACVSAVNVITRDDHNKSIESLRLKLLDEKLNNDKLESYNRQDNIILFGYEEPAKNYEPLGRETPEELEQILVDVASKVGVTIDPTNISDGFRLGKKPSGTPVIRDDGLKVARPILYKLNKRSKRSELLRKKKDLKNTHKLKISEDVTPLRKALCDVANESALVKVAYPQEGKILVRTVADPSKVIRLESFKDLRRIPDYPTDHYDWDKLKLSDIFA